MPRAASSAMRVRGRDAVTPESLAARVTAVAATSRGKPYLDVVSEVHAVLPGMPIRVVRLGTGHVVPGGSAALVIAVDAKGTVIDFPEDWTAGYAHAGVVATFGTFG